MNEILEKLGSTVVDEDSVEKTNFQELYKNWGRLGNQEERRKELLEVQKHDRRNKLDTCRGILDIVQRNEEKDIFKSHSKVHYTPNIYVAGFHRKLTYSNVLMLSEWMIEKPEDFHENWYITPCPKAKRVLVVANYGTTKLFTKCGRFVIQFRTALPGGNPSSKRGSCSVIDCFYDWKNETLHVLDLLAWNNQPMTDCDTEFRHFWLKSQFADLPQLNVLSKMNKVKFNLLPMIPCTPDSLNTFMMTYPPFNDNVPQLDGLLLYHKKAHYVSGETPLVGWLYSFMVLEILGDDITLNPKFMEGMPASYVDQADFIQKFELNYAKGKKRGSKGDINKTDSSLDTSAMDADDAKDETVTMESDSIGPDIVGKNDIKSENGTKVTQDYKDSMEADNETVSNNHIS